MYFHPYSESFSQVLQHLFDISFEDMKTNVDATFHQSVPASTPPPQLTASETESTALTSSAPKPVFIANVRASCCSLSNVFLLK
jgi:hypothetical protein